MNEQPDPADAEFESRTRALLEGSAASLPARTRSRLTQARHAALAHHVAAGTTFGRVASWQRWLPAGAVSAAVLAALLMQGGQVPVLNPMQPSVASAASGDDLELLADRDALELVQDQDGAAADVDYEFYGWAVGAANDADGSVGT